jgi:hypothetical protein
VVKGAGCGHSHTDFAVIAKTLTGSAVGLTTKSLTVRAWAETDARIAVANREEFLWAA